MSFTNNSDSIWWNIEKWKCNYMMVNIYPSKLMEINVIVWSRQKQQQKKKLAKQ